MQHDHHAYGAGSVTRAQKCEEPAVASGRLFMDQVKADSEILADNDPARQALLILRARYASAGFALQELSDGSLLATAPSACRPLPDARAAHRFLDLIGGRR